MKELEIIPIKQPIGLFYLAAIPAPELINITQINQRIYDEETDTIEGTQRAENGKRTKEIAAYCSDPDATFPTSIIISVQTSDNCYIHEHTLHYKENTIIGEILDGQHRIIGLRKSNRAEEFQLPVVLMFDLSPEQRAYVFSIINSKQTKVPMSLIYDLYDLNAHRSPQKTCHDIARLFNSDKESPFYRKLKLLGRKETGDESLSQGSFVRYLLPLVSATPDEDLLQLKLGNKLEDNSDIPFRYYFVNNQDEAIYKILFNMFNAIKEIFPEEWGNPDKYILSKTTGYAAIIGAFYKIYKKGLEDKDLSKIFFIKIFQKFRTKLKTDQKVLTSEYFSSNEQTQKKLAEYISECI